VELKKVQEVLDIVSNEPTNPINGSFLRRMELFASQAKQKMDFLESEMEQMTKEFKNLSKKFGEDPETYLWEDFFSVIMSFNDCFESARIDLERQRNAKVKMINKKKLNKKQNSVRISLANQGGVDDLLKEQYDIRSIRRKQSMRRAKSIRRVQGETSSNVNNLLSLLGQMKE